MVIAFVVGVRWLPRARFLGAGRPWTILGLLAALSLAGCGADPGELSEAPPVSVEVARVAVQDVVESVELVGELLSTGTVFIQPEIDGIIKSLNFAEGQFVPAGTPLYNLDDAEQQARLHSAEATVALNRAIYKRTKKLAASQASSAANLDRAAAELEIAKADLEFAQLQLDRTVIRAPWSGMVGLSEVFPGQRVESDTTMVRMDNTSYLQVIFSVPEQALTSIKLHAPIEFTVSPYPDDVFAAKVFFISPTVDFNTRRITVKGRYYNDDGRLRPGLFANIRAELGTRKNAILVPEGSLVYDRMGTFVWKVVTEGESQLAKKVPVTTGVRKQDQVEIVSGLSVDDMVVISGTNKVYAGATLTAMERQVWEEPKMPDEQVQASAEDGP